MNYEALLDEAYENGLIVKEKPLKYNDGRIKESRIAIRKSIETSRKKLASWRRSWDTITQLPEIY